jgi:hypothetical protein
LQCVNSFHAVRAVLVIGVCTFLLTVPSTGETGCNARLDSIFQHTSLEQYIRSESRILGGKDFDEILAMMIRFENFGCLTCLNVFMEFCDSLRACSTIGPNLSVILIIAGNEQSLQQQTVSMKRWARENEIFFPLVCIPRQLFEDWKIERSTVLLLKKHRGIELSETIPLSRTLRDEFIARLRKGLR